MPISVNQTLAIIFITGVFTFLTRLIPFLVFGRSKKIPRVVTYLGIALPPTVIAVLLVYCIKNTNFGSLTSILPTAIAITAVVAIHLWKGNNLLSIGGGTVLYMILVQVVFK